MKSVPLFVVTTAIVVFCSAAPGALTIQQPVPGQWVVYDDVTGNNWYRLLYAFKNMTYAQQITAISSLGTYGGLAGWHMADADEMALLWQYTPEQIGASFTSTFDDHGETTWTGRYDKAGVTPATHYTMKVLYVWPGPWPATWSKSTLPGDEYPDGTTTISAWVVTNPIPAPGAFVLGSIGLAGIGWLRRRRALR